MNKFQRVLALVAVAGSFAAANANAAGVAIDVTEVVGTITAGITTVSAIGAAALSLVVVVKLFKWVRSAL